MLQPQPAKIGYVLSTPLLSLTPCNLKKTALSLVSAAAILLLLSNEAQAFSFLRQIPPQRQTTCLKNCQVSENGYALIRFFEGYSPFVYKDVAGYDTIGYGHLITSKSKFSVPLSPEEAQKLLESDTQSKVVAINRMVRVPLNQNQFDALASFTFNLGTGTLQRSTLLRRLNANLHSEVPTQLKRFVYAGGKKIRGLAIRREAEANLYTRPTHTNRS